MKKQKPHSLIWVLVITILFGALQAILSNPIVETSVYTTLEEKPQGEPSVSSSEVIDTKTDYLSNGVRVIKTKTPYFENEVQVWLASEQACKSVGLGDSCISDLMGIAFTETRSFNYKAVGDGNKSWGAFQIHLGYHPDIKPEQATDPYFAAKWTIKRMLAYGYLKDRDYAIMAHNGTPGTDKTLGYLATVNKYINM